MPDFIHLHCHTEYSLLDGSIRLSDLCSRANDFKMPAAAITDHGNLFGAAYFYTICKARELNPIIGCEVYVTPDYKDVTTDKARIRHHLILLSKNNEGYHNLVRLVSRSYIDGFYFKPRVDKNLLKKYSSGLIALSACIAGEIPRTLLGTNNTLKDGGSFDDALKLTQEYKAIFTDGFYLEVQANNLPQQKVLNEKLFELADYTGLHVVATNDCHYLNAEDVDAHDVLLCIQTQTTIKDTKRFRFETRDLYYKSPAEMAQSFPSHPEVLSATLEIAEQCRVEMDFTHHYFPVYTLPEGMTLETEFQRLAREGLRKRMEKHPNKDTINVQTYWDRLEHEMSVICEMGFPGYFLIVQDFINWAKDHDIPVGPGRGSAAGSVVAWALRITNLDPLPYNLLFERFLNIERVSLPDIDVDFCEQKRTKVIQYVTKKYGADSVSQITTFGKMKAKAVIRDVGRALDISLKDTDKIAKLVPDDIKITIDKALKTEPELASLYETDPTIHKLIDISKRLEGLVRHASTHAAGVVVSDKPMEEYLPLYRGKKGELVTQFDMKMVEKVGLVKFDFLGLRTMTLIDNTLKAITEQGKQAPNLDILSLDDPKVYEIFSRGDTDGVFQVESSGMRQYLRMLRPSCFEDLIAMLALYRPGPLGSGMVDEFIKRKHGEVKVDYMLDSLESCLKDTYGIIVYQEQVMQIAQIVAGYTLGGADLLRRAMGKKNAEAMAEERSHFLDGAEKKHIDKEKAKMIFDLMEKFAEYGFNKSHSAAYALISYHTAFLKVYFKVEFMAALLTSEIGDQEKILKYIEVCKEMGIRVKQPDIQTSRREFIVRNDTIIYGMGGIKNIGDEAIREIVDAREKDGKFTSLLDLCTRVNQRKVTKRVLENLIKSGACDAFGCTRATMMASMDMVASTAQKKSKKQSNQNTFFSFAPNSIEKKQEIVSGGIGIECPKEKEWGDQEKLHFENDALGFFLTSHPLERYSYEIDRLGLARLEDAKNMSFKTHIKCAVIVTSAREITNKKGNRMAFVTVEDFTGSAEVTFFSDEFIKYRDFLESDQPLLLTASIENKTPASAPSESENDEALAPCEIKLRALSVQKLDNASTSSKEPVLYDLEENTACLHGTDLIVLQNILEQHKGATELILQFRIKGIDCKIKFGSDWHITSTPALLQALDEWKKLNIPRSEACIG